MREILCVNRRFVAFVFAFTVIIPSQALASPAIQGISGSATHDQNITITGTGFGTRPSGAPLRWDNFEAGTIGQNLTGWDISSTIPSFLPKYSSVGREGTPGDTSAWERFGSGNYNSGIGVSNYASKKFYVSGWVKGSTTGDPSRNVKLISFRGPNLSDPEGRLDQYPNNGSGHIYTADCNGVKTQDSWQIKGTLIIDDGSWHRFEAWIDLGTPNGNNGLYQIWKDTVTWGGVLSGTMITSDCSFEEVHVQHYYATDTGTNPAADYYWDELYIDTSRARIEIGNASTWSASTHREIQIPSTWSSTAISAKINRGSFAPGSSAYLFVVDDTGVASAGYPITIGSGGSGDTTPPTLPANFNLTANATSASSITVSWNPATDNIAVTGYQVERCLGLSCSTFANVGNPTASPFVDSGLSASTGYSYHVRATDAAGNLSGWSNVVGATTQSATPVTTLTIDNTNTNTSHSGSWSPSTNFPGYYGTNYHYSPNATGHWFEWTTSTLSPGTYEVYAYWNANPDRPTDVSYLITHSGGTATRNNINQTQNGSQWNLLGTYTFGTTGTVRVQSGATGIEGTVADAIRFVKTNTVACNTVTTANFSQSTYNNYGAPFDAFQTNTNLMNTTCTSTDTHTINLATGVTGDTTRIVYTKGYWYDAVTTAWRQYTGTCTGALNGEWCQGSVSATITDANVSTASSANPTYLVGMTCSVQGDSWKCGCRDTSCTNFSWQIQGAGL